MHVGTKQSRLRTSTTRRSSNELTNLNFGKSELMQTRPSKLQALTVLLLNKSKIFVIAWMLDNTNNLSLNASWLLSPQAQRAIERLNSPFVADGTDHENRENILNRKTRENRINLIELNSSEEQDSCENNKVINSGNDDNTFNNDRWDRINHSRTPSRVTLRRKCSLTSEAFLLKKITEITRRNAPYFA